MKTLIMGLGKYFVGLWIYQPFGKARKWCVTFRDFHGEYWETDLFDKPEDALKQAKSVIARQVKGIKVKPTGESQKM